MAAPLRISLAALSDGAGGAPQQEAAGGGKKQQQTVSVRVCGDMVPGCAVSFMPPAQVTLFPCSIHMLWAGLASPVPSPVLQDRDHHS